MGPSGSLPSLSVVVPNYNHAKYLPACLNAILSQSVQPLEVLVLDDASKDNSVEVIREFAIRNPIVRVIQNEQNLGVMRNLNKGVELSRGDYVFIGSADDEVLPGLFEKSMCLLAQYPKAGLSCTVAIWRYVESGLSWHMAVGMAERPSFLSPADLVELGKRGKLLLNSNTIVFRKAALQEVGMFHPALRWHADWFAMNTSAFRYGVCYLPEALGIINILPKSFFTAGTRSLEHRQVLTNLVELLNTPAFGDVRPRVRDSAALSLFATPMLRILLSRKEFRPFINFTFLIRTARRSAELIGKKILPTWLARWFLKNFYGPTTRR